YKKVKKKPANIKVVDPIMISRMLNNQRDPISKERPSPNPFLIIPSYIQTLIETLHFERSQDLFWGEACELPFFSGKLFNLFINEISSDSNYKHLVDILLMDYVPYAKQLAYKELVWRRLEEEGYASDQVEMFMQQIDGDTPFEQTNNNKNDFAIFVGVAYSIMKTYGLTEQNHNSEVFLMEFSFLDGHIEYFRKEAVGRLYLLVEEQFLNNYQEFFYQQDSFKSLSKKIVKFIKDRFIPMLYDAIGRDLNDEVDIQGFKELSLGYRVRNIVQTDIAQLSEFSENLYQVDFRDKKQNRLQQSYLDMLESAKKYIQDLKLTQYFLDQATYAPDTGQEAEILYSESIQNDWEKQYSSEMKKRFKNEDE
ncbi:TPA: hypothetical protein ACG05R_001444, partial [Enterococcus faecium]